MHAQRDALEIDGERLVRGDKLHERLVLDGVGKEPIGILAALMIT